MMKSILIAISILVIAPSIYAQDYKPAELFIGYSNVQGEGIVDRDDPSEVFDDDFFDRRLGMHGINTSIAGYFNSFLGIKGDFSFNRNEDRASIIGGRNTIRNRIFYFMGGPTFRIRNGSRVGAFAHVLAGGANTRFDVETVRAIPGGTVSSSFDTSSTDFAAGIGGGIDIRVGEHYRFRAIQVDYLPVYLRDRSVDVLGSSGAIVPITLEGQRQDNIRFSVGFVF
jgi:Outer membrane protein beta-barrel domain